MRSPAKIYRSPQKKTYGGNSAKTSQLFRKGGNKSPNKSPNRLPNKSQNNRKYGGKSMYKPKCASTGSPYKLNSYGLSLYEHYKSVCPKTNDPHHKYMKNNKQLGNDELMFNGNTCDYLEKIPQMKKGEIGHLGCAQARQYFTDECAQEPDSGHTHRVHVNTKAANKCAAKISKRKKEEDAKVAAAKNKPPPMAWGANKSPALHSPLSTQPSNYMYEPVDFPTLGGRFLDWH